MGLRLYRRLPLHPGVHANLGTMGLSVSFGHRGAWYTLGPYGRRTATLGWPGTGLVLSQRHDACAVRTATGRSADAECGLEDAMASGDHGAGVAGAQSISGKLVWAEIALELQVVRKKLAAAKTLKARERLVARIADLEVIELKLRRISGVKATTVPPTGREGGDA